MRDKTVATADIEDRPARRVRADKFKDAAVPVLEPERTVLDRVASNVPILWIGYPRLITGNPESVFHADDMIGKVFNYYHGDGLFLGRSEQIAGSTGDEDILH